MRNTRFITTLFFVLLSLGVWAQVPDTAGMNDFEKAFFAFDKAAKERYESFRDQCNKTYAEGLRQAWDIYQGRKPVPLPKEEPLPPVPYEDKGEPIEDKPVVIEEVIDIPAPTPQPQPVEPIEEKPQPVEQWLTFTLYGTPMKVRLADEQRFRLPNTSPSAVADAWQRLSAGGYDNALYDCLALRQRHQLCDWSYLQMLDALCNAYLSEGTSEAELLKGFLFCQSGYQMRFGVAQGKLVMLYGSRHRFLEKGWWEMDGICYYADHCQAEQIQISPVAYPHEKAMSLYVTQEPRLDLSSSPRRTLQSPYQPALTATVTSNRNLMAFCEQYPTSVVGDDFMTRWAMYAQMPLSSQARQELYPQLRKLIEGKSNYDAVNLLCRWVQTAFVYEYDDKVWGRDRAFFADETLYYPYADCEYRSILLTRIVRDLLGLDCLLVFYPGHLATAIALGDNARGDYIILNGKRYLVCDPTYICAPIGCTMEGMDNRTAKVIKL